MQSFLRCDSHCCLDEFPPHSYNVSDTRHPARMHRTNIADDRDHRVPPFDPVKATSKPKHISGMPDESQSPGVIKPKHVMADVHAIARRNPLRHEFHALWLE